MTDIIKSSLLYRSPSALKGAARIVSIFGNIDEYATSSTEKEADIKALEGDWQIVGQDIKVATQVYERVYKK